MHLQTKWESNLELPGPLHPKSGCKVPRSASDINLDKEQSTNATCSFLQLAVDK